MRTSTATKTNRASGYIRACMLVSQRRTSGFLSCMSCGVVVDRTRDLTLEPIEGDAITPSNMILVCATCRESRS